MLCNYCVCNTTNISKSNLGGNPMLKSTTHFFLKKKSQPLTQKFLFLFKKALIIYDILNSKLVKSKLAYNYSLILRQMSILIFLI